MLLRIPQREQIYADRSYNAMPITIILSNVGDQPAYVSPAIGEIAGRLSVFARPADSDQAPTPLYSIWKPYSGYAFEDLFKLMPHRSVRRTVLVTYEPLFKGEGVLELWAEYDASDMARGDSRAFAGVLKSERVRVKVVREVRKQDEGQ